MAEEVVRVRSEAEADYELDYLRGYLGLDPSCPAREVRDEIVRKLQPATTLLAHTWLIPHRGDPCIFCRKLAAEVAPGGCPVTIRELYSRIGDIEDLARDTEDPVQARALTEEAKRLRLLHLVLTRDLAPAVPK